MRYLGACAVFVFVVSGCTDSAKKLPIGGSCIASEECADGLCVSGHCLDPDGDEDFDGLSNRVEVGLGTNPFASDSDGDGVSDGDELDADFQPRDSDGDGKPDAIESRTADVDKDCLADEYDPHDDAPDRSDSRVVALVAEHCPATYGVCAASGAMVFVDCPTGLAAPICNFASVPDYEASEATCDGKDNDCDGDTDEPVACVVEIDPIDVGLIGHWPLDGDGKDVGPYADDGVVSGATPAPDRFGVANKALSFSATGDRVSVAATHHPLGEVSVTYSAWVRPEADGAAAAGVLAFGDVLAAQRRSSLVMTGKRGCLEYTGEQNDLAATTACAPDGVWSFFAVVKQGRHVKLYLNGRLREEGDLQAGQALVSTQLAIGLSKLNADQSVYEQFHGTIDDVRAWSRALSDSELDGLYHAGDWADVGSAQNPGASCLHVRDGGRPSGDGQYWIDPTHSGTPIQAYCDMTLDGGGWTLVWAYGYAAPGTFSDVTNAVTPVPNWRGSNINVPISTTPPTGPATPGAIDWSAWAGLGNEIAVRADYVDTVACTPVAGSLVDGVSGAVTCRVLEEKTATCDGVVPQWLGWTPSGPYLATDQSLFLYFDGATDANWPTHDPCGTNVPPPTGASAPKGGALYLRSSDAELTWPAVCAAVPGGDRVLPTLRIDPDGPGGRDPFVASCDFTTERGGWTRLSHELAVALNDLGPRPREYLYKKGGAWYRSPVTHAVWSWTSFARADGIWVHDGPTGEGAFDCDGDRAGAWGIGCGTSDAEGVLPGLGDAPVKDETTGSTTLCQAPPDAFQIGGEGCTDASVWVRPTPCMPDADSLLGDGGLADWATRDPMEGGGCWNANGPEGTMVADDLDYPPGGSAPSIRATNPTVDNDIWALILNQQRLTFIAGRAYRLGFWAKAAAVRPIRVFIQTRDLTHAFAWEDIDLDTTWRYYELGFVADATSFDAMLDFQLAELSTAAVWLDDITLSDEGQSPCTTSGNELVADGGFAAGRTCWRFGHDSEATQTFAQPDPDEAATSAERPSIVVEQSPGTDAWRITLIQVGKTLAADRHYRFSLKARAATPRGLFAFIEGGENDSIYHALDVAVSTSWQTYTLDFVTTNASTPGAVRVELQLGSSTPATLWLDSVSLVDVGPSPCSADNGSLVADGAFAAGAACWQFDWNRDTISASANADMTNVVSGHAPSLAVTHAPGTDQVQEVSLRQDGKTLLAAHWYRLSYWARAASPRTIRAAVWDDVDAFVYREPAVDTTWRYYQHDFSSTRASSDAAVEFHLAALSGATVWLDDVRLEDLGPTPCVTSGDEIITDGELAGGLLCWLEPSPSGDYVVSQEHAPNTSAPSLAITNHVADNNLWDVQLIQRGFALTAGEAYQLRFWARAAASRTIVALVHNWDTGTMHSYQGVDLDTTWQEHVIDFVGVATEVNVLVEFQLGQVSTETVWIDGVSLTPKASASTIPTAGLVLHMPFAGDAQDLSGHANHGTVHGATLVADRHGNPSGAYAFDGVDNYIDAPIDGLPLAGADRTLSFWLAPDTSGPSCGSTGSSVVYYGTGDCTAHLFGAGYCASSWYFWGGCYDWWPQGADPAYAAITTSGWSFVAMRLASGLLTVRVDDITMQLDRSSMNTLSGSLLIGAETIDGGQSFRSAYDGRVDDVRVYDRALTDEELDALRAE